MPGGWTDVEEWKERGGYFEMGCREKVQGWIFAKCLLRNKKTVAGIVCGEHSAVHKSGEAE